MRHLVRHTVRFADSDPAGIAFYPRIFDHLHEAFEDFFDCCAGTSYAKIIGQDGLGFPAVQVTAEFLKPLFHGEIFDVELTVASVGQTSFTCHYRILRDREVCATARIATAVVELKGLKSLPIPQHLRKFLSEYLEEGP